VSLPHLRFAQLLVWFCSRFRRRLGSPIRVSGWRGIGRLGFRFEFGVTIGWLAGLAFMFSTSILLQILACALYNNWWPMLAALMYVLVPMPCLFFGGGSTQFLTSRDGGGWFNAAKFLTGASAMGSIAIPAILRHAGLIETGAMFIEFTSFFILVCTVMCFHRATLDEDW
ncbi:Os01g0966500, partial [Oryza sativa Japonica Group]